MARPKGYDRDAVLTAARDLFWEQGYERASVADLEQRTGLNRSGIYQEFGSKHGLFVAALDCYADRVITGLLAGLRDDHAGGLDAVAGLFWRLAELFRCDEGVSARGCMMVNAIAELAAHDPAIRAQAEAYRDRLRASFGAGLTRAARLGETKAEPDHARARLLAAALMGVWLTVRIDPADASALCQQIARQVESWRIPAG
jgi:TetR/AcrR family transcriptional regulator, transcriptional repressor for nem operon